MADRTSTSSARLSRSGNCSWSNHALRAEDAARSDERCLHGDAKAGLTPEKPGALRRRPFAFEVKSHIELQSCPGCSSAVASCAISLQNIGEYSDAI